MAKKKKEQEELKIFVIVPETVQVKPRSGDRTTIHMPFGRLAAQTAHAVSSMRMNWMDEWGTGPITTIVLSVRNSRELRKVEQELWALEEEGMYISAFQDSDEKFYGTKDKVLTAICTCPCTKDMISEAIGHLELL